MGKHGEAVIGTLCEVDLSAWMSKRSMLRNILVFKRLLYRIIDTF